MAPEPMLDALRRCIAVLLLPLSVAPVVLLGPSLLRAPATLWHELDGHQGVAVVIRPPAHRTVTTRPSRVASQPHLARRAGPELGARDRVKRGEKR